jgi:hypothetical protein
MVSLLALQLLAGGIVIRLYLFVVGLDVYLGGFQPAMAHELLNGGHLYIGVEQIVGKTVAQAMASTGPPWPS